MDAALDEENPNPEVLFSKGVCAFNTDRKDEAAELFKRAVAIDAGYEERVKNITEGNK